MKKVLIIDDNTDILEVLFILLTFQGFTVQTIWDGEDTVKNLEIFKPDVILLDISLAGYDGREICKQLKSPESPFKHIPIILFSAMSELEIKYLECGANDFIKKPFDTVDLVTKIKKYAGPAVVTY